MQRDGDGDGAFSSQGGHGPLCLRLITRGFDPGATQVGQLVELHTVLLQDRWALWWWTCFCERTWRFLVFIFLLTRVSITAVSLACKNSREETTKTLRRSKDEKKVRKSDTGSCGVEGFFSKKNLTRNFETLQTGSRTMQAAAGLPLLSGSYATSCKPFPLRSLCSCAATLLQNHWQLGKWTKL